jgi:hypothetical protein
MNDLIEALNCFEAVLHQVAPTIATRLQPGLTIAEIEEQLAPFSWKLPDAAVTLYRWHNGLSGKPGTLNLVEKLIRLKGKWHGELSGRENEIHLKLSDPPRSIVVKFLPLEYALAGHRHLKLGRCSVDLLPFAILNDDRNTFYCMMRLDCEDPIIYCANGTNLPPIKVTETFLSTQPQFKNLSDAIAVLMQCFQGNAAPTNLLSEGDVELDIKQFDLFGQSH